MSRARETGESAAVAGEKPRRGRILSAAFNLFLRRGYAAINTRDIARLARVSKRELYALFASKQAILASCIADRARQMRLPLELPEAENATQLAETMTRFGSAVLTGICDPAVVGLYRLAAVESQRAPDIARALDASGRQANHKAFADVIARAQRAELLAAGEPLALAAEFFALLHGDLHLRLVLHLAPPPTPAQIEERARAATAGFLTLHAHRERTRG